jgi:hypothetical protein
MQRGHHGRGRILLQNRPNLDRRTCFLAEAVARVDDSDGSGWRAAQLRAEPIPTRQVDHPIRLARQQGDRPRKLLVAVEQQ